MIQQILGWLGDLPLGSLYVAIAALSAFELLSPFPSDAVIAFGSFVDRGNGSPVTVFLLGGPATSPAPASPRIGSTLRAKAFLRRIERYAGPMRIASEPPQSTASSDCS
jgi:hypothetical protein